MFLVSLAWFPSSLFLLFQFLFPYLNHLIVYLLFSLFLTFPTFLFLFLVSLSHLSFFLDFDCSLLLFGLPQNLLFIAAKFSLLYKSSNSSIIFNTFLAFDLSVNSIYSSIIVKCIRLSLNFSICILISHEIEIFIDCKKTNPKLKETDLNLRKLNKINGVNKTKKSLAYCFHSVVYILREQGQFFSFWWYFHWCATKNRWFTPYYEHL